MYMSCDTTPHASFPADMPKTGVVLLGLCQAFKFLAFFELDIDRQCRMHKRRVDMLLAELHQLNPQYYLLVSRQLMFELAETYSSMLDLKVSRNRDSVPLPKVNPIP